jgi:hypothetical protein
MKRNMLLFDKNKHVWVNKCFRSRKSEGEYWILYKELPDDKIKCYQYFRTSKHQLLYPLQKIERDLKKGILPSKKQYHQQRI